MTASIAGVERYFERHLSRQFAEWHRPKCPIFLGIDEHFFSRRQGYATTLCHLKNHKFYEVLPGLSELSLEACLQRLQGEYAVQLVAMDLSATYRSIVRKQFPNARIEADRFHVIRFVNHHLLLSWRDLDPAESEKPGFAEIDASA